MIPVAILIEELLVDGAGVTAREEGVCVTTGRECRVGSVRGAGLAENGLLPDLIPDVLVAISEILQGYLHHELEDGRRVLVLLEDVALEEAIDCSQL